MTTTAGTKKSIGSGTGAVSTTNIGTGTKALFVYVGINVAVAISIYSSSCICISISRGSSTCILFPYTTLFRSIKVGSSSAGNIDIDSGNAITVGLTASTSTLEAKSTG